MFLGFASDNGVALGRENVVPADRPFRDHGGPNQTISDSYWDFGIQLGPVWPP